MKERIAQGFSSRAALKLVEMHSKHRIFFSNPCSCLDLGCAPGGWTEVAVKHCSTVIGIDLVHMKEVKGSSFIQGDILCPKTRNKLTEIYPHKFDVLLSDMGHQFTGMRSIDVPRVESLCDFALLIALEHLRGGGSFVCKFLKGEGDDELIERLSFSFDEFHIAKPSASRKESSEVILYITVALFYWQRIYRVYQIMHGLRYVRINLIIDICKET